MHGTTSIGPPHDVAVTGWAVDSAVVVAVEVLLVWEAVEVILGSKVMWVFLVLRVSVVLLMEVEVVHLHLRQLRL